MKLYITEIPAGEKEKIAYLGETLIGLEKGSETERKKQIAKNVYERYGTGHYVVTTINQDTKKIEKVMQGVIQERENTTVYIDENRGEPVTL